jgi:hypothetical protein
MAMKTGALAAFIFLGAIMIAAPAPAEIDGKWEGKVKTQIGEQSIRMSFKSDGNRLTGTVNDGRADSQIEDGTIEGATISFKQTVNLGGSDISFTYIGKVNGDQIVFTREPFKIEFTARRVK